MEINELEEIFKKYLNRSPRKEEYTWHVGKEYFSLVNEILGCKEYQNMSKLPLSPKHKIAVLVSGHIRNNNFQKSISFLSGLDYDVFVHTWDNIGTKGKETDLNDFTNYDYIEKIIKDIPNIKKYKIENNKEFINGLVKKDIEYFNYSSPEKFIKSQLYSINQSYKIFEEYRNENSIKYDMVIKIRFDNEFIDFKIDNGLIFELNKYKIIFTPNIECDHIHPDSNSTTCQACEKMYYQHNFKKVHSFMHTHVICDIFAYGSVESMKHYCSLYDEYDFLNKSFEEDNKKVISENMIPHEKIDNVYLLDRNTQGHLDSLYYINCSYPERLLQYHLKDYILPASKKIKIKFKR